MKAVIFDMDGVLVNSEPIHFEIEHRIFKSLGFTVSDDEMKTFAGLSQVEFWKKLKKRYDIKKSIDELLEYDYGKRIEFFENIVCIDPVFGIPELLENLKSKKIKLAIASSSFADLIDIVMTKLGLKEYFDVIVSGHEAENGKPDPDIFLYAADRLGVKPEECLVIEDSENGVKAAVNAGMKCAAFKNPDSGIQDLSLADTIIDTFVGLTADFLMQV